MSQSQSASRWRFFLWMAGLWFAFDVVKWFITSSTLPTWAKVMTSLTMAALFAAVLLFLHLRLSKTPRDADPPKARQAAEVTLEVSMADALASAQAALSELRARNIRVNDQVPRTVRGRTRMSWKSWGEWLTIELNPQDIGRVVARVSSVPIVATTVIDYGKNRDNVRAVCAALDHQRERPA